MESDKFQDFMTGQFDKLFKELKDFRKDIKEKLEEHDKRFDDHDKRFDDHDKRFNNLEKLALQHHEELEKVAKQVEKLVVGQERLQHDVNFLLRKTSEHDEDIIQLKKAK